MKNKICVSIAKFDRKKNAVREHNLRCFNPGEMKKAETSFKKLASRKPVYLWANMGNDVFILGESKLYTKEHSKIRD